MDPSRKQTPVEKNLVQEFQKLKITKKNSQDVVKPGKIKAAIQASTSNDEKIPIIPSRKPTGFLNQSESNATRNKEPKIPVRKPVIQERRTTGYLDQSTNKSNSKHNEEKIPIIPSRKPAIQESNSSTGFFDKSKTNTLPWIKKNKPPLPPMKPPREKMENRKEMPDLVINTPQDEPTTGFFDQKSKSNTNNMLLSSSSHSNLCYGSSPISPNPIIHSRSTSLSHSCVRINQNSQQFLFKNQNTNTYPNILLILLHFIFQLPRDQEEYDDEGYLLPEDIGIPNHVRQMLLNSKVPVHSSSTLPYLKPRGESRASLSIGRFQENTNSTGSHPNLARKKFSTICRKNIH